MKRILPILLAITTIGSLIAVALMYFRYSTSRPLMTMSGTEISKKDYQDMMDALYGKATLTKMAYARIIHQAALKAGGTVADKDIDARIAEIHRVNPSLVETAQRDPLRGQMLRDDTRTTLELENIRLKDVHISDEEIKEFYEKNKTRLGLPLQVQTSIAVANNQGDAAAAKEMMDSGIALNIIGRQPRIKVVGVNGWTPNWNLLPPADRKRLSDEVNNTGLKQTRIVPIKDIFFVVRIDRRDEGGVPAFEKVKDRVTRFAKLSRAPKEPEALARLYKEANVTFEVPKYAAYFDDVNEYLNNMAGKKEGSGETKPVESGSK